MYLIVDHPCNLSHHFASSIEHRSEDFRCHDEARGTGIDGNIARHQPNVAKFLLESEDGTEAASALRVQSTLYLVYRS